jgi:hypothetical protein
MQPNRTLKQQLLKAAETVGSALPDEIETPSAN